MCLLRKQSHLLTLSICKLYDLWSVWRSNTVGIYRLDWIVQCYTSPPTQYRLYGRLFLQVKRPNQQYQSMWKRYKGQIKQRKHTYAQTIMETKKDIHKIRTSPLVYNNMGRLGGQLPQREGSPGLNARPIMQRYPQVYTELYWWQQHENTTGSIS